MKKAFQISLMFTLFFTALQGISAQNTTGHFVCCRCAGKGAWYSTYLDANSNVQILQTNCGTCNGTGMGECDKADLKPVVPKPTPPTDPRPNKLYLDYLIKVVNCRCGKPIPTPDDFWKTRPDLKW